MTDILIEVSDGSVAELNSVSVKEKQDGVKIQVKIFCPRKKQRQTADSMHLTMLEIESRNLCIHF